MHTSMLENTNLKQFLNKDIFEKENSAKALGFLSVFGRITKYCCPALGEKSKETRFKKIIDEDIS